MTRLRAEPEECTAEGFGRSRGVSVLRRLLRRGYPGAAHWITATFSMVLNSGVRKRGVGSLVRFAADNRRTVQVGRDEVPDQNHRAQHCAERGDRRTRDLSIRSRPGVVRALGLAFPFLGVGQLLDPVGLRALAGSVVEFCLSIFTLGRCSRSGFLLSRPDRGLFVAFGRFSRIHPPGSRFVGLPLQGGGPLCGGFCRGARAFFGSGSCACSTSCAVAVRASF